MKRRTTKLRARQPRRIKPLVAETPLTPYDPQAAAIDVGAIPGSARWQGDEEGSGVCV